MTLFGILNVDKPPGCTSRDVVNRVERIVSPDKAGHAGTLDPLASGVLVICVGKATRLIQYVQQMRKQYRATFLLGHRSDTDDSEGDVVVLPDVTVPDRERLEAILPNFLGEIQQAPPAYSAIKLAGRRAYQLARQGRPPELAPRAVTIHNISVEQYVYPELKLSIECGSGTYVRALGRDIAAALGTTAVMSALRRNAIGRFRIEDALAMEELSPETLEQNLQSAVAAVGHMPRITLHDSQLNDIRHGRPIDKLMPETLVAPLPGSAPNLITEWAAVDGGGRLTAILMHKPDGLLWPRQYFGN